MSRRSKPKKRKPARPTSAAKAKPADPRPQIDAALKASYERLQKGQNEKAEDLLRKAIAKLGRDPQLLANLMASLENQGKTDEALRVAEAAAEAAPEDARTHNNLGALLKFRGRFDEATERFRRAVELVPTYADAWRNLSGLKRFDNADDPDITAMKDLLAKLPRNHDGRAPLYFAIGRALDEAGDLDGAFEHWERGNRNKRGKVRFSLPELERLADETTKVQTAELVGRGAAVGATDAAPILIVGMPRSGSSLVEQILASHPDVVGVGEVPDLPRAVQPHAGDPRFRMQTLAGLGDKDVASIGRAYANSLDKRTNGARRVVDKYLTNFVHLGTLRRAVPNARIIHATRGEMAGGFACYKTLFTSEVPFVYDLEEIGGTMRAVGGLMDHWREVMPEAITTVKYETLVGDLEGQTRELLSFLDLPWNDACLRFHETDRRVNSASSTQVRQPLYTSALDSWTRYEDRLAPLAQSLEIPPLT